MLGKNFYSWKSLLNDRKRILKNYNAILMDLWGVIFDGNELYPQVHETLEKIHEMGIKVIFFSNVPQRKTTVQKMLEKFSIDKSLYNDVISSGELVYETLKKEKVFGSKYFHLGSAAEILNSLEGYEEVKNHQEADFTIITSVLGKYNDSLSHYDRSIELAKEVVKLKLPLLCTNPDKISITKSGEVVYCPGMISELYEGLGGKVIHFGKPHRVMYEYAMTKIAAKNSEILAIGDSIANDIVGASNMKIDSLLVCSGIHRHDLGIIDIGDMPIGILQGIKKKHSTTPNYVAGLLRDLIF